jgi:hypothetical protein
MVQDNDAHCQYLPAEQECVGLSEALDKLGEAREALRVAAKALAIASDWHLEDVQVDPPSAWKLEAYGEEASEGWCSVAALARKLRELGGT